MKIPKLFIFFLCSSLSHATLGQSSDFELLKARAFSVPDSVHKVALAAYDEAWINGENDLTEWAYLLGLTDYLQSAFLSSNAWYHDALGHLTSTTLSKEDSLKWIATLWNNIGINHEILLDYHHGYDALEKSKVAERELNNTEGEWITAINQGLLLHNMGEVEAAILMLEGAVEYFSSTGDLANEGKAWLNLGLAEAKNKHFESANQAANRALDIFKAINDSVEVFNALVSQGECLVLSGELNHLAGLFAEMDKWRPQRLTARQEYHEKILEARWEIFNSNVALAQQYLDSAHQLADLAYIAGSNPTEVEAIIEIAHAQGRPQLAYNHLLTQISDFEKQTNEMAAGYALQVIELQERSQRLASIKSLRQELEYSEKSRALMTLILGLLLLLISALIAWMRMRSRNQKVIFRMAKRSLYRIKRTRTQQDTQLPAHQKTQEHGELFLRLEAKIEQEQSFLSPSYSLSTLANSLQANPRYVSEAIKNARGINFSQFINEMRIERAVEMLMDEANNHLSLDQIAESCGFSNLRTFYRNFERQMSTTPAAFRKMAKSEKQIPDNFDKGQRKAISSMG